jgi:hypothetical protein
MMTTSRRRSVGARHCSTYARKIVPFIGPSIMKGATIPLNHAVGLFGPGVKAGLVAVFRPHMDAEVHAGRVKPLPTFKRPARRVH